MAVLIDLIDGSSGTEDKDGLTFQRIAKVTGVSGSASQRLINALSASGLPAIGDPHPSDANLICVQRAPRSIKPSIVEVVCSYRTKDTTKIVIEVGSSINQVDTNKDKDGNQINVQPPASKSAEDAQGVVVTKYEPRSTMRIHLTRGDSPGPDSRRYVGAVNKVAWSLDPAAAPRTWLCTRIVGVSEDRGATYDSDYEFEYKDDSYDIEGAWINPETGRPMADSVEGAGLKTARVQKEEDFNGLITA